MSFVPQRPNFPVNRKTVYDIQMELIEFGSCRVYGLGMFKIVEADEEQKFNWLKDEFKTVGGNLTVEFVPDHRMRTLMNGERSKLVNHYVPPKQLGV